MAVRKRISSIRRWLQAVTVVAALVTIIGIGAPPATAESEGKVVPGDAEKGKQIFQTYCASCHGKLGAGDGPAAAALTPKPANLAQTKLSNQEIFKIIKEGGAAVGRSPLMAAWGGTLSDQQIEDIIAFIRKLPEMQK